MDIVMPASVQTSDELAPRATDELAPRATERLDRGADQRVRRNRPSTTQARYGEDMRLWARFCAEYRMEPLTASSGLLSAFALWLDKRGAAPSVMRTRVAGVASTLRTELGLEQVPVHITRTAMAEIATIERKLATKNETRGRGPAEEITPEELRAMFWAQPDDLMGLRTRTYLVMAAYLGNRISENAALLGSDITRDRSILRVHVRWSKTGPKTPVLSPKPGNPLCPVTLWHTWRDAAGITTGPAFPAFSRRGSIPQLNQAMTTRALQFMLDRAARRAGLTVHVTGHTFRAFMATQSYLGGASIQDIADQGGWRHNSTEMWRYIRRAEEIRRNATTAFEL